MYIPIDSKDDSKFLGEAMYIVLGAALTHQLLLFCIKKVDNWFDHKWLGLSGSRIPRTWDASKGWIGEVDLPPFASKRVIASTKLQAAANDNTYITSDNDDLNRCTAYFYLSGNSLTNQKGSLMGYIPVDKKNHWIWYVGFTLSASFQVSKMKGISTAEIESFREKGKEIYSR